MNEFYPLFLSCYCSWRFSSVQILFHLIYNSSLCEKKINFYYSIGALGRWNSNAMKLIYIVMLGYSFILHMFIKSLICTRCQITNCVYVSSRSCHLHEKGTWNTVCSARNAWKSDDILSNIWFDDFFSPFRGNSFIMD